MSQFLTPKYAALEPYVPGEQPANMGEIIKLNTNELPYSLSQTAREVAHAKMRDLRLYPDPTYSELREAFAAQCGCNLNANNIIATNGSDEVLDFAFAAFCDSNVPAIFADITYGFYPVFAAHNCVPFYTVSLCKDFTLDVGVFAAIGECDRRATLFIANPNAPTGLLLSLQDIERILQANPQNVVVIDEAYIDFAPETSSAVSLVKRYDNLLVTQTFSKSRGLAGARLGFGVASEKLIADLNTIRNAVNPYNVNSMTVAYGLGVLSDNDAVRANCACVCETREFLASELRARNFEVLDSSANFVFARHAQASGSLLYEELKARNILVRHFTAERIEQYNRISIGTREDINALLCAIDDILGEQA